MAAISAGQSGALRRIAPNLRRVGWVIELNRRGRDGERLIRIEAPKRPASGQPSSPESEPGATQ
jgi:hypothetical protein